MEGTFLIYDIKLSAISFILQRKFLLATLRAC